MAKNKAKMNKFLTGAITATMVATAVAPVASAASFTDLDNVGSNVKAEIDKAVELGFFKDNDKFNPSGTINRSQAAFTIARYIAGGSADTDALKAYVEEKNLENTVTPFKDVPASYKNGTEHQEELYYASLIVKDAGSFTQDNLNPTGSVTRSQMAKIISGAFGLEKAADFESKITDIDHLDADTKGFIETIASNGVTNVTKFNPAGTVTRSQMASFLVRANDAVQEEEVVDLAVESVSAINATEVEVKFNVKVDKATAETHSNYTFNGLDSQLATAATKAELSKDGKTVTVTVDEPLEKRYQVKIDGIKAEDETTDVAEYDEVLTFAADTTAPTILGTERVSSNKVKIKFSEPVKGGTITAKYADGTDIAATAAFSITLTPGANEVVADLSHNDITVDKDIVVTFNGVSDMAGNLISPQPAKVTIKKEAVDGVEPTIETVSQSGAKKFVIKFGKDLDGFAFTADKTEVEVSNNTVTGIEKLSASEYEVTVDTNLDDLQTVTVKAGKAIDLAGQANTDDLTKLVTFKVDDVAPKATAKLVVGKDNKEYIELNFDKDVAAGQVTVAGSKVKDYVTTTGITETVNAVYADGKGDNKKVLHVPLTGALADEKAEYNVTISSTAVKSDSGEDMEDVKFKFTRGKDGEAVNTNSHVVTGVAVSQPGSNNEVEVEFTIPEGQKLDGATATNLANYSIAGAEIESISLAAASDNGGGNETQVATLTLKEDSNTFTGVRNITVKNVKVSGSTKVMDPVTINNVSLNENVAPKVEKAELTATDEITITFSEAVTTTAVITDFELVVGGETVANEITADAETGKKVVKFTLENPLTAEDVAKGIEIKVLETISIEDSVGNTVSTTGNIKVITN